VKLRVVAFGLAVAGSAHAQTFTYEPPGKLVAGSGMGRADMTVYAPGMRFPIENGPAYANSQVYERGGYLGPAGSLCDPQNFSYPWKDNYCETRTWDMPLCPSGQGHQGQDIRAATCEETQKTQPRLYWAVAAVDGRITNVGSYSVYLTAADGTRYDYLHMSDLAIKSGDAVTRGQRLGKVSNAFNGAATTIHLHFNLRQNVAGVGMVYVSPYMSLVESYETLMGLRPDAGPPPPEPPPVLEPAPVADEGCGCRMHTPARAATPLVFAIAALAAAMRRRRWS
jgi:murein DD-endopeptidase MepM/ murein hydrolase activator NlpD